MHVPLYIANKRRVAETQRRQIWLMILKQIIFYTLQLQFPLCASATLRLCVIVLIQFNLRGSNSILSIYFLSFVLSLIVLNKSLISYKMICGYVSDDLWVIGCLPVPDSKELCKFVISLCFTSFFQQIGHRQRHGHGKTSHYRFLNQSMI